MKRGVQEKGGSGPPAPPLWTRLCPVLDVSGLPELEVDDTIVNKSCIVSASYSIP